jgi:hypothetical protein
MRTAIKRVYSIPKLGEDRPGSFEWFCIVGRKPAGRFGQFPLLGRVSPILVAEKLKNHAGLLLSPVRSRGRDFKAPIEL